MLRLAAGPAHAGDLGILAREVPEADAAGRGGAQRHQVWDSGEADPLLGDLADHDALQARRL